MTESGDLRWTSCARTETGKVRRSNEDDYCDLPATALWAVADGMGGHGRGALASRMVVEALMDAPLGRTFEQRKQAIISSLDNVHRRLGHELTLVNGRMPGSTVAVLTVQGRKACCLWAGDSRCYLLRRGKLYCLTKDHNQRRQWLEQGIYSEQQIFQQAGAEKLTRAIGGSNQSLKLEQTEFVLADGDRLLLCTDGLYKALSTDQILRHLNSHSVRQAVGSMVDESLCTAALDNITALGVFIKG